MAGAARRMILGAFFNPTGHHVASWRHPQAQPDAGINLGHHVAMARTAEAAKLHFVFLADQLCVRAAKPEALSRSAQYVANFEPLTLLGALAAVTERIGLIATASTSYNEPYHVARKFASLDHMSGGRVGWNIVTSTQEAEAHNFGRDRHLSHDERYRRAREFVQVVETLWDSWDDDAFLRDQASGRFFDHDKLHRAEHRGEFFRVDGALNVPRPPQGHPVLVQAGQSNDGRGFASEVAEIVFCGQPSIAHAQRFYADVKARAAAHGRSPDAIRILPGFSALIGESGEAAEEEYRRFQSLVDPVVALEILSTQLGGFDFSKFPIDGPMPDLPDTNASQGAIDEVRRIVAEESPTIREMAMRTAAARGKNLVRGSAKTVADIMEQWFVEGACDGFVLMPTHLPGGLDDFVGKVLPELRRRGLFRDEYEGATLRENLGFARPASRYAAWAVATAPETAAA